MAHFKAVKNGKPKNESFVIPLTITGPYDLQPQPLDFRVHEETEDEPGVVEVRGCYRANHMHRLSAPATPAHRDQISTALLV